MKKAPYIASDVWAAAAAATRINKGYNKENKAEYRDKEIVTVPSNKALVHEMLVSGGGWTEEDNAEGIMARMYWQGNITKILSNTASQFEIAAINASNKNEIAEYKDMNIIACLISGYHRGKVDEIKENSNFCGNIGENISVTGKIISSFNSSYSYKYKNELITDENNVFCWWGNKCEVGSVMTIRGRIKSHTIDRTNSRVTVINYVMSRR